jgi:hypothetical protein
MHRIWELVAYRFRDENAGSFVTWVKGLDSGFDEMFYDFANAANDPTLGSDRRHAKPSYRRTWNRAANRYCRPLSQREALTFTKTVIVAWVKTEYGQQLHPQTT